MPKTKKAPKQHYTVDGSTYPTWPEACAAAVDLALLRADGSSFTVCIDCYKGGKRVNSYDLAAVQSID